MIIVYSGANPATSLSELPGKLVENVKESQLVPGRVLGGAEEGSRIKGTMTLTVSPAISTELAGRMVVDIGCSCEFSKETVPVVPPGPVATWTTALNAIPGRPLMGPGEWAPPRLTRKEQLAVWVTSMGSRTLPVN